MKIRSTSSGVRIVAIVALALAVACSSDDGPDAESAGGASSSGGWDEAVSGQDLGGSDIAGRGQEGAAAARRIGLETVYFDYNRAAIREDGRDALRANYEILRGRPDVRVELQGNCDERGSAEYNFALGERRAKAVRDYLVRLGVSPSQLTTVSFGEENASVVGHSESAWSRNRRVDFAVLP
jgi:peptidoglycan-associated lipoprotein